MKTRHTILIGLAWCSAGVALLWALPAPTAFADIVRLSDGQTLAGRVIDRDSATLRFRTGSAQGPRDVDLPIEQITTIHSAMEEAAAIEACTETAVLFRWSEGYFQAGLPSLAAQCVERAVAIQPGLLTRETVVDGAPEYQIFWCKQLFRIRASNVRGDDARGLHELARWSAALGLAADARETLRRAAFLDPANAEIHLTARAWGVSLLSWVQPDLTLAVETSLFAKSINDEGVAVSAQSGREFLLLPIRYQAVGPRRVISRLILSRKDRPAFYGVYALYRKPVAATLTSLMDVPVYERMEAKIDDNGTAEVVWKNNVGPRVLIDGALKQEPSRQRPLSERPQGHAILILEIESAARELEFQWDDGSSDRIDLGYLRELAGVVPDPRHREVNSPHVSRALQSVSRGSAAHAELALRVLAAMRIQRLGENQEKWASRVEPIVWDAAMRPEEHVQAAAWRYFSMQKSVSAATLELAATSKKQLQRRWVEIIAQNAGRADSANPAVARRLLMALLRGGSVEVCEQALAAMHGLKLEIDWSAVSAASKNAQIAALTHLASMPRVEAVPALLDMMKSVRRSSSDEVAKFVRSLKLRLDDPRDPIINRWPTLKSEDNRVAVLTVLRASRLGELIYSAPFAEIVRDCLAPAMTGSTVQTALFELLVEQASHAQDADQVAQSGVAGGFPLPVRLNIADPWIAGLTAAAQADSRRIRRQAVVALLDGGYAALAADQLVSAASSTAELREALLQLLELHPLAESDAFVAVCGRLLRPEHAELAETILNHLHRLAAARPVAERWRLACALKAGVEIDALSDLVDDLRPSIANGARRWLYQLCHLTHQDRQTFEAARNDRERRAVLEQLDFRRAQLVDGRYGMLAVVEWTTRIECPTGAASSEFEGPILRWSLPRRKLVILPTLQFTANERDDGYAVIWNEEVLGVGLMRDRPRPIRTPDQYMPALMDPPADMLTDQGWGWPGALLTGPSEAVAAAGPAILPGNRPVLQSLRPDFATIEIADCLSSALQDAGHMSQEEAVQFAAEPFHLTLRYATFASYVGVAPMRPLPKDAAKGHRHILNVMVMLERID